MTKFLITLARGLGILTLIAGILGIFMIIIIEGFTHLWIGIPAFILILAHFLGQNYEKWKSYQK